MNCAEFQRVLPYIIETGGNPEEEEHLRNCKVCSDLVLDLKYIAEQAKLLVPMEEPNPRVWDGIRSALEREGMVRPVRGARGRLLGSRAAVPWAVAAAAVVMAVFAALVLNHPSRMPTESAAVVPTPSTAAQPHNTVEADDQQLLSALADANPSMRETYEHTLQQVNQSIADAQQTLEQNPDDSDVRQYLVNAYEQKAMLYDMATQSLH